jgi:hypothetical protein
LGITFEGPDQETYWDNYFGYIFKPLEQATMALELFNSAYKLMLELTGQPIPGGPAINPMDVKYQPDLTVPNPYSDPSTTVVTTVNIGTEKVDTVVANSIRRIGVNPRQQ